MCNLFNQPIFIERLLLSGKKLYHLRALRSNQKIHWSVVLSRTWATYPAESVSSSQKRGYYLTCRIVEMISVIRYGNHDALDLKKNKHLIKNTFHHMQNPSEKKDSKKLGPELNSSSTQWLTAHKVSLDMYFYSEAFPNTKLKPILLRFVPIYHPFNLKSRQSKDVGNPFPCQSSSSTVQ